MKLVLAALAFASFADAATFSGAVTDPTAKPVSGATVNLLRRADSNRHQALTNAEGLFTFATLEPGEYRLVAEAPGFPIVTRNLEITGSGTQTENVQFTTTASQAQSVTVTGDVSDLGLFAPDPAQRIMIRDETLDANPGRPGMPISIPGLPSESRAITASLSPCSFKSAAFSIPITCPPTPTAMAMRIRT
jgi:hypothetical protein